MTHLNSLLTVLMETWQGAGILGAGFLFLVFLPIAVISADDDNEIDASLQSVLEENGFTGRIESTLEDRLGRPINPELRDLGRLLFFDPIMSLHNDNGCAGCHSPAFGFGDPQSIAYGVSNNGLVGPNRDGTRNERKAPLLTNSAFFSKLMLNGRFEANSGDPFDNSQGFKFPFPNEDRFQPNDPLIPTLLTAQAFLPVPSLVEMAGFQGTAGTIGPRLDQFDDGLGTPLPHADETGTRQESIRQETLARLSANEEYRELFENVFGTDEIVFTLVGQAMAEFQTSILAANAPIDQFARGDTNAMTDGQKRGALLFFGEAKCSQCHTVGGQANEMFSDMDFHNVGVPQISPDFGVGKGNLILDGPGENEDFGRERISGKKKDRYRFRTSPIRNVVVQPAFFHNGAFVDLEDALRFHLDSSSALDYDPVVAGVDEDLHHLGPIEPVLKKIDKILKKPVELSDQEFADLLEFVGDGLLDPRALPANLCGTIPGSVPSGMPLPFFEGCQQQSVQMCHVPSVNADDPVAITVPHTAIASHLAHGDSLLARGDGGNPCGHPSFPNVNGPP